MLKVLCLLLVMLTCAAAAPDLEFRADTVGGPDSGKRAELYLPPGPGPFPGMIILHGCDGVGIHYRTWARQLRDWGYAAMLVDSFTARGFSNICDKGILVPPLERAQDAFAAADYLRRLPNIRGGRIGVIGFSHGAWTVLKAVLDSTVSQDRATPFAAAVAFYPYCEPSVVPLATDTLILIGEADDWTPAALCQRWYSMAQRGGHSLDMKVYPGALHGFDSWHARNYYMGHYTGRDPKAAEDALATTREFLARRLTP